VALRRRLIIALAGVAFLTGGLAMAAAWSWRELNMPLVLPEDGIFFEVERGAALSRVTGALAAQNVLKHPRLLDWYASLHGDATAIHTGEYELKPGLTAIALLAMLRKGEVYLHQFTIVEGLRFADMLHRLRTQPAIAATELSGEEIMAALGEPETDPEGEFLPDTYSFPRGTKDVELLGWAHEALQSLLTQRFESRTDGGALTSPYEGLILASIIEKETALDSERGLISGVFHERLRRGMRLQTDPTVIYGLGDAFDGNLTKAQLEADTPYNTYTRRGLPPTPIALPGAASIRAAFAPVQEGYLYFVATGEPDGSHVFSKTLEEHNAAVRRYIEREREGP
jgi:peptidoglycan lytic transglycosylase G